MDKPPSNRIWLLSVICLLGAIFIGVRYYAMRTEDAPWLSKNGEFKDNPIELQVIIQGNSYRGMNMSYFPTTYILGIEVDECFYKIIEGESRFDEKICNRKYGCGSGIGFGQLTAVAIKDCEKGLNKKIDPYNGQDNLECSIWLYEKYGTKPWGDKTTEWGSYDYFKDYCL